MNSSAASKRVGWVDGVKGLAIVLVVYGHVAGGLEAGGILKAGSPFLAARDWVYLFHMPVFFLVSGLFAQHAIGRAWRAVFGGRVRTLAYPYAVWTGIYLAASILMARFANNPPDLGRAARF
jgi:fucose 4-O-acetylase-like acetyltransferase